MTDKNFVQRVYRERGGKARPGDMVELPAELVVSAHPVLATISAVGKTYMRMRKAKKSKPPETAVAVKMYD